MKTYYACDGKEIRAVVATYDIADRTMAMAYSAYPTPEEAWAARMRLLHSRVRTAIAELRRAEEADVNARAAYAEWQKKQVPA